MTVRRKTRAKSIRAPKAELSLILETDMEIVAPTCKAMANIAKQFLPIAQLGSFELALNEAITNAIEHGNLGITEKEKIELCERGELELERQRRSVLARKLGKTVTVKANFKSDKVAIKIADVGRGFDWKKKRTNRGSSDLSGRGLNIIGNFFDEVIYNKSGNQQTLVKKAR
jgi:anti-sigma regulatory factor (Ser/Thr protein kinase)